MTGRVAPERLPIENGTLAWFRAHRWGISATDAPAVLSASPSLTAQELWKAKTGRDPAQVSDAELVRRADRDSSTFGIDLYLLRRYTEMTGRRARRAFGLWRSRTHPWMLASVDARVVGDRRIILVEKGLFGGYNPAVALPGMVQMQHTLEVTGADVADVIVMGGHDQRVAEVPRDEELIAEIVAVEAAFWRAVEAGRWPPTGPRSRCCRPRYSVMIRQD